MQSELRARTDKDHLPISQIASSREVCLYELFHNYLIRQTSFLRSLNSRIKRSKSSRQVRNSQNQIKSITNPGKYLRSRGDCSENHLTTRTALGRDREIGLRKKLQKLLHTSGFVRQTDLCGCVGNRYANCYGAFALACTRLIERIDRFFAENSNREDSV